MQILTRFPVELVSGKGSVLIDTAGKSYIDMGAGIAVNTFGVADESWQRAVTAQLSTLQHTSNLYYTAPCAKLAKMLCERTGMKKVFFSNSGAEANECAIKAARKYAENKFPGRENVIVTLKNSFHGRTLATLAATGQDGFHKDFLPVVTGFAYAEPNDIPGLEALMAAGNVAAVMLEAVQGEGGVLPLDKDFVKAARALCDKHDALLIADEVSDRKRPDRQALRLHEFRRSAGYRLQREGPCRRPASGRHDAGREGEGRVHPWLPRLNLRRKPCLLCGRDRYPIPHRPDFDGRGLQKKWLYIFSADWRVRRKKRLR